jgi:BirA family transcriptional regulator, biotin operon repressor / biotin---[acetyl-CoA-carboxylase] ligase
MSDLETAGIQRPLSENTKSKLEKLELFSSIASTNTYLLSQRAPAIGRCRVALADHQTSGRGRLSRRWLSPRGSGLYLSLSFTFATLPENLPALTLALGVGTADALTSVGIGGVALKWPNDLVAEDGKLGGILTEVQSGARASVTVVTGLGLNLHHAGRVDLGAGSGWANRAIALEDLIDDVPARDLLAGTMIEALFGTMARFEAHGFADFAEEWKSHDWLRGREVTIDMPDRRLTGVAAGVDVDGALIVDTGTIQQRVVTGSVVAAGPAGDAR